MRLVVYLSYYESICLSVCASGRLPVSLRKYFPVCLSVRLVVYLSHCVSIFLSVCVSGRLPVSLRRYFPVCLSVRLVVYLSHCGSSCLSVCVSILLCVAAVVPHRDTLTSGVHAYEFCFMLPPGAPPSFVGTYGNINYSLSLHTAQGVQVTQQYVGVVGTLDVSSHPDAMV